MTSFNEFLVNLNEIFDTKIPVENWKTIDDSKIGELVIDDATYIIKLDPLTYTFDKKTYNFINVVFRKMIDGIESEDLTYTNKAGSKVIGAIVNAVKDEIKKFKTDAIVFVATDHVEQRMRIYNKLLTNLGLLVGDFRSFVPNVKIPNGKMSIIFNKNLSDAERQKFIEHTKNIQK